MLQRAPWTSLHARLHHTLRQRQLLPEASQVLVAVSGGQDSLCLITLLLDLQPLWGWHLAIAHCDHGWRSDSTANAEYVASLATTWDLPFYCPTATTIASSEAEARQWRYQVLYDLAEQHQYDRVATGHTASDRAETLLYNLVRGSGMDGLQALTWQRPLSSKVQLVRPLLAITRTETAAVCQDKTLTIWQDSTNQDMTYARNRLRQEVIPYLQHHFNPRVEYALAQTAELLQADVDYLEAEASKLFQQALWQANADQNDASPSGIESSIRLRRSILQPAPLALQRRVMRQVLQQILPAAPRFEQIEKLVALISAANGSQTDPFPGGAIASVRGDWICVPR